MSTETHSPIQSIAESIRTELASEGYEMIDLVPVPIRGDRMVRLRTLEEALDDFERVDNPDAQSFLVQVRPKSGPNAAAGATAAGTPILAPNTAAADGIYLSNGKTNVPFLLKNATLLFSAGEHGLARNIYSAILGSGEKSSTAHYWIGRTYEAESNFDEAQNHYEQSITYEPTIEAYQRQAALLIRQKKDQEAAELMERASLLRNLSPAVRFEVHRAAGNCWLRCERPAEAEQNYLKALECDPRSDAVLSNLGSLCLQRGDASKARKYFQDAIALNPRNDKAIAGIGSCHFAEGDLRLAHEFFARSLEVQINNPTAIFHLVKCAYELKNYATAARLVSQYVESAPVNTQLLYSLAGLQFHLGKITEAKATATQILGLQPEHAGAKELLNLIEKY